MRLSRILILVLFVFSLPIMAQEKFLYESRTCKVWIKDKMDENSKMQKEFLKLVRKKGYKHEVMIDNNKIFEGDIYFELTKDIKKEREVRETKVHDGKLEVVSSRQAKLIYRDCQVTLKLKRAKGRITNPSDETLFEGTSIRSHPRLTLTGEERCVRAMWDASVNIPECNLVK